MQHIAERDRIKQRIIRVEVTLHLLPKIPGSQETGRSALYARFWNAASGTVTGGRDGSSNRSRRLSDGVPLAWGRQATNLK